MIATFCLRLACGMVASMAIIISEPVPPRFFRVQFMTALGLLAGVVFFDPPAGLFHWVAFGVAAGLCFAGSVVWHLHEAPWGRGVIVGATLALCGCLAAQTYVQAASDPAPALADNFASAAVVGAATTSMLVGHSYLVAPSMTIAPLMKLLGALAVALTARIGLALAGLGLWTASGGAGNLESEMLLWLPVRWALGLLGPLVLGWMAWETARIRSTQSATGILYVVCIVAYLGELTSQLLWAKTGYPL